MLNNMDLVLLVGTNPLPNYITAKSYFLNYSVKRIWLAHSSETQKQMKNLSNILQKQLEIEIEPVSIRDEGDPLSIEEDIKEQVLDGFQGNHLHLNYTGGTKAMGIHVYRAIENQLAEEGRCSFSYLSASKFQLMEDNKNFITGDLRKEIDVDFKTLFELHGFKKVNPNSKLRPDAFLQSTEIIKEIIDNNEIDNFFRDISETTDKDFIIELGRISRNYYQKKRFSLDSTKSFSLQSKFLQEIVNLLPEPILNPEGQLTISNEENFIECADYLANNKWFEYYVFYILRKHFAMKSYVKIDKNWEFAGQDWGKNKFELDVLMLIGYQFVGISCTTISKEKKNKKQGEKSLLKSKGFEVIHRTRQIGGDEARAILITMAGPHLVQTIEKELQLETGNTNNIRVLGRDDLKEAKLVRKIRDFINLKD
ncbi:PDDEXK family nuclease [Calditrichota bacterium GD2]